MKSSVHMISIVLVSGLLLTACNGGGGADSTSEASSSLTNSAKVAYEDATFEEVADHVQSCHGNKICVTICHRPPGNPDNSKTLTLPLQAANAHLKHGGSEHQDKDYLGACDDGDGDSDDGSGGTDDGSGDGSDDGSGSTDDGSGGTDIPAWCLPFINYDSNCDGIHDETGESYF